MSHFPTLVIFPNTEPFTREHIATVLPNAETLVALAVEAAIAKLLAPYDESVQVEEYERPCYCIGFAARHDALAEAIRECGTIDDLRGRFQRIPEEREEQTQQRWKAFIAPFIAVQQRVLGEHPQKDAPDPACGQCNGKGGYASSYNPRSKWDFYTVGGRWDGWLGGKHGEANMVPIEWLLEDDAPVPFAIVTPDGEWHQKADMHWWGITSNEDARWPAGVKELLSHYADHYGVCVDCHI